MKEQEIIDHIAKTARDIGDDCAVIPKNAAESFVISTDVLNENVHFLRDHIPPQDLGYKALAVNLSDIAAMGAEPKYALLTLALPQVSQNWLEKFMEGFNGLASYYGVELMGGDTTRAEKMSIGVTIIGEARNDQIKYRQGAEVGDFICVTDTLGDSATGLGFVLSGLKKPESVHLINRHYRPCPNIEEGRWLSSQLGVHAMMDLSDSLDVDLGRLCQASGCGARIDLEKLPMSEQMKSVTKNPHEFAVFGGENYCLVFTVAADQLKGIERAYKSQFQKPFYVIGQMEDKRRVRYYQNDEIIKLKGASFEHFEG